MKFGRLKSESFRIIRVLSANSAKVKIASYSNHSVGVFLVILGLDTGIQKEFYKQNFFCLFLDSRFHQPPLETTGLPVDEGGTKIG